MEASVLEDGAMWGVALHPAMAKEEHLAGSSGRSGWKGSTQQAQPEIVDTASL